MLDILKYIVIGYCALAVFVAIIGFIITLVKEFPTFFANLCLLLLLGGFAYIIGRIVCQLL